MSDERSNGIFNSALQNQEQVNETFFLDFAADSTISQNIHNSDLSVRERIRQTMEQANKDTRFLFDFTSYGNEYDERVNEDLVSGAIAAIDSTDLLPITDLMNTSYYCVGVGCITSRSRGNPEIFLTSTTTKYSQREEISSNETDLAELCRQLDQIRDTKGSWATTFREYRERRVAIDCEQQTVLLDGPIFTQNLLTQQRGRDILLELVNSGKRLIGVIKDLSGSWTLSRWTAMALQPGEGFVLCPIQQQYRSRFSDVKSINDWISNLEQTGSCYVRVVYRPAEKAFAFECALSDFPYAVSLLRQDASPTLNHEIPMLLETVDSHLRGSNNAAAIKANFIGEIQRNNYRMGIDITGEREYR